MGTLPNSEDPDEMLHNEVCHRGLNSSLVQFFFLSNNNL